MQNEDLVSTKEAAAVLEIDRSLVTRLAASGDLAVAIKAPGRNGAHLYRRDDVDALKKKRAKD